jgi:hypothetical protein
VNPGGWLSGFIFLLRSLRHLRSRNDSCLDSLGLRSRSVDSGHFSWFFILLIQLSVSSLGDLLKLLSQFSVVTNLLLDLGGCLLSRKQLLDEFDGSISGLLVFLEFIQEL